MILRTFLSWCKLSTFMRKRSVLKHFIANNWSYTLVLGDCDVYCKHKIHLMTFEQRVDFNLKLMFRFLKYQMLHNYEKRQTAHL